MNRRAVFAIAAVGIALCVFGALVAPTTLLATYLAAWWCCIGIAMGGLANVWLHDLTGGAWGEAVRAHWIALGRVVPLLALAFVPIMLGFAELYPWAASAERDRWAAELSAPAFKQLWLSPAFVVARSAIYLALWSLLALHTARPRRRRSARFAAFALLAYGFSASFAAFDWIMALAPLWYSSLFGLLAVTANMLAGLAAGIVLTTWRAPRPPPSVLGDLGNLLLMYVLSWAYLAFMQYLIIWAANLPHEIAWYVPRVNGAWRGVAVSLIVFHFCVPLAALLVREVKRRAAWLGAIAAMLLAFHLVDVWWTVLPSVSGLGAHAFWLAPATAAIFASLLWLASHHRREVAAHA